MGETRLGFVADLSAVAGHWPVTGVGSAVVVAAVILLFLFQVFGAVLLKRVESQLDYLPGLR